MNTTHRTPDCADGKAGGAATTGRVRNNRWILIALLAVCIAPVLASYAAYYWLQPGGRINYGDLIAPQIDVTGVSLMPTVAAESLPGTRVLPVTVGKPATLQGFAGRWVFVVTGSGQCDQTCEQQLFKIRQVRLTTGKFRDRVERLWLLTDDVDPSEEVLSQHEGMWVGRASPDSVAALFPTPDASSAPDQHIYLIDPLGHLMMRFPVSADPNLMKKDISRLLKASRIG